MSWFGEAVLRHFLAAAPPWGCACHAAADTRLSAHLSTVLPAGKLDASAPLGFVLLNQAFVARAAPDDRTGDHAASESHLITSVPLLVAKSWHTKCLMLMRPCPM